MRFLVRMNHHRFVVEGPTRDDANEQLEGHLLTLGLDRTDDVVFEELSAFGALERERPAA